MKKWNEVDFSQIVLTPKPRGGFDIKYGEDGDPFRFQIPVGVCENGMNEFSSMVLRIDGNTEFFEWFSRLEDHIGRQEPWDTNAVGASALRVRTTETTQFFDGPTFTFEPGDLTNTEVRCILEVSGKYGPFNEKYGLTCKAYQLSFKRLSGTCLFSENTKFEDFY
jgi:hypothetical protein